MGYDMDLGVRQTWLPTQRLQLPCRVRSGMLFFFFFNLFFWGCVWSSFLCKGFL